MLQAIRTAAFSSTLALTTVCCQDEGGLLVPDRGVIPRADARVQGHDGKMVTISYEGEPVTLTLDASHSSDPDGRIAKFRWLSGSRTARPDPSAAGDSAGAAGAAADKAAAPAAGSGAALGGRYVPEDAARGWPDDVELPSVTLDEGSYAFSLWVIDERGYVSAPDVVRVVVAVP